jgi:hypothetical protein
MGVMRPGGTAGLQSNRSRHGFLVRAVAVVVVTLLIAGLATTIAIRSNNNERAASTTTTTIRLSPNAKQLVALLAKKDKATYHALYSGSAPNAGNVELETWQRPPDIRQDSHLTVNNEPVQTSAFVLDQKQVRCVKLMSTQGWNCQAGGAQNTDPLATIRSRLGDGKVSVRDTTLSNRTVRCFEFTAEGQTNELCVTPDQGIPVLVRANDSQLTLLKLDTNVSDRDFVPPAEVKNG